MNPHKQENNDKQFMEILKAVDKKVAPPDVAFLNQLRNQSATEFETALTQKQPRSWRYKIMHSKALKWLTPLAAAAVILIALVLWPDTGVTKVYGMADVPELFYTADTIHMKGKLFFPSPGSDKEPLAVDADYWLDLKNNRWRKTDPVVCTSPEGMKINISETICDGGDYEITINHTEKKVFYGKVSEYKKLLFTHQNAYTLLQLACGDVELFDSYQLIGQEEIEGQMYNIWEACLSQDGFPDVKMQSWLSPETGDFAKVKIWMQMGTEEEWCQRLDIELIERNVEIPQEIFSLIPPDGYALENTKETANDNSLKGGIMGSSGDACLTGHILFALEDGALILCWSSEDAQTDISRKFEGLELGGSLPILPYEINRLKTTYKGQEIIFDGYHLAYTQREGKYYEWSIYCTSMDLPKNFELLSYVLAYKNNMNTKNPFKLATQPVMKVINSDDFQLVLGAMAELSDHGQPPAGITYDRVLDLAQQLRQRQAVQ